MFEKILYPTDFSEVARKALGFIARLKGAGSEEIVVLHVIDSRNFDALPSHMPMDFVQIQKAWEERAAEEIKAIAGELRAQGYRVKERLESGVPFREILRVAEEENASVIVLGSHGKSNMAEMFLGSVSEKVIRKSRKPVLVVKR